MEESNNSELRNEKGQTLAEFLEAYDENKYPRPSATVDMAVFTLNENAQLTEEDLLKKVTIDMVLPLDEINFDMVKDLEKLEPFGKANSKPLFGEKNVNAIKAVILGKNRNVLKLKL